MKKWLKLSLCLLTAAASVQAQVLVDDSFDAYGTDVDLNGQGDWVADVGAFTVTTNEVLMEIDNSSLMLGGGNSVAMQPGDILTVTMNHRVYLPPPEGPVNFNFFQVGFQDSTGLGTNGVGNAVACRVFYNNWENGAIKYSPINDWGGPEIRADAYDDCGFDHKPNVGTVADPGSDMLQMVYTLAKSHVTNEFASEVTFNNIASNVTKSVASDVIVRENMWVSSDVSFFIKSLDNANGPSFPYIDSVKVELTPPSAAPDAISALGLDGEVQLSWAIVPGAAEYDLYKTTTSGDYSGSTAIRVAGNSYLDTDVVNDTTYYYTMEAVYYNGNSDKSVETAATPKKVFIDETVIVTDFSGDIVGDLADADDWGEVSGSGSNAFAVVNGSGSNQADTVTTMADFDMEVGNAVYVDNLMGNEEDDVIEGYIDVIFSTTPSPGTPDSSVLNPAEFADFENQGVMEFGISSSTAESLEVAKDMMAMFHVSVRHSANLIVMFGKMGTDNDDNRLAALDRNLCGWYPKDNAWNSDGSPADLETDPLRISWKIRKTRDEGVYQAWASISNMNNLATSDDRTDLLEFELIEDAAEMYAAPAALFAMGHSFRANVEYQSSGTNRVSILNATVLGVDVSHSTGNLPVLLAPTVTDMTSVDRGVLFNWNSVLDSTGYDILMETDGGEMYLVEEDFQGTSYTDSPRWNGVANTYTVRAKYDPDVGPGFADSDPVIGTPEALTKVYDLNGSGADWLSGGTGFLMSRDGLVTNATTGLVYLDRTGDTPMIETDETSGGVTYLGPTLYGLTQRNDSFAFAHAAAYSIEPYGGGQRFYLARQGWGDTAADQLAYAIIEDMEWDGAAPAGIDATTTTLGAYYELVDYTDANNTGSFHGAIRNGSDWYVSERSLGLSDGAPQDEKPMRITDVMDEVWYLLIVVTDTSMTVDSTPISNAILTDINAVGWYFNNGAYVCLRKFEVQTGGETASYDYWADSMGLVSSNSAPMLDPDSDAIINEKEYAFGGDPLVAETADLPAFIIDTSSTGSDFVTCIYKKQRDPGSELSYEFQTTTDLMSGWSATGYTTEEGVIDYYWTGVTNRVPYSAAINEQFYKVDTSGL